jgi:hypothetical protein
MIWEEKAAYLVAIFPDLENRVSPAAHPAFGVVVWEQTHAQTHGLGPATDAPFDQLLRIDPI